jgi:hypothetical protein
MDKIVHGFKFLMIDWINRAKVGPAKSEENGANQGKVALFQVRSAKSRRSNLALLFKKLGKVSMILIA